MFGKNKILVIVLAALIGLSTAAGARAQGSQQEMIEAWKGAIAANQKALLKYQWVETTVVYLNGEAKSTTVKSCSYGKDGKVVKVVTSAPAQQNPGGLRGRIMANKKEELTDYMDQTVDIIKSYLPPDQKKIKAAQGAGGVSVTKMDGGKMRIDIKNYQTKGDLMTVNADTKGNGMTDLTVSTFNGSDPVSLVVKTATLPANWNYFAEITVNAPAKNIKIVVTNDSYKQIVP